MSEKGFRKMIDYADGMAILLERAPGPAKTEEIELKRALGSVLSVDVFSDVDLPPFNKAAMDGFALKASDVKDLPATLPVVMDIPAGGVPTDVLSVGQAASIMTGAPVPEGADTVIQVEWTSGFGDKTVTINKGAEPGRNISPRGEILRTDEAVLRSGALIGVEEAALLASVGCDPVPIYSKPKVAVLSTGDELIAPSAKPGPGQIRNSNSPALLNFVNSLGLEGIDLGRVPDRVEAIKDAVTEGLKTDCLLLTGGVSQGAYDFVGDVLGELGVDIHFTRLAVKPGKPTLFGTRGDTVVFGLPGNPISASVIARIFVEPALRKKMGQKPTGPRMIQGRLLGDIRKKPDRLWFVHGKLELNGEICAMPITNRGSADVVSATTGDCLIVAPKGVNFIERHSKIDIIVWNRCLDHI